MEEKVHPFAVNILSLQRYNTDVLDLDRIVIFDWLVIKFKSFGYTGFYYQMERIEKETGMKRRRLEAAFSSFVQSGILTISKRGVPCKKWYLVNVAELCKRSNLSQIYRAEHLADVLPYFQELAREAKAVPADNPDTKGKKKEQFKEPTFLMGRLNRTYSKRREMYNNGELTNDVIPNRQFPTTAIPFNKINKRKLAALANEYADEIINKAFEAYADAVILGMETPNDLMALFLSFDENRGAWTVFERYLNHYNNDYKYKD